MKRNGDYALNFNEKKVKKPLKRVYKNSIM